MSLQRIKLFVILFTLTAAGVVMFAPRHSARTNFDAPRSIAAGGAGHARVGLAVAAVAIRCSRIL